MVTSIFRKITRNVFVFANVAVALFFLFTYIIPFLNPHNWWWVGFLGLLVPYATIILFFFLLFWMIIKPKRALISLLALVLGWHQVSTVFAFNIKSGFEENKDSSSIRILSWNVANLHGTSNNKEKKLHIRSEIADAIHQSSPDIVCLQEFNHSHIQSNEGNNIRLFEKDFPYHYFPRDGVFDNDIYQQGSIIFSKYPIVNRGKKTLPGNMTENLIYVDILYNKDTIRIYTCHLQSFQFAGAEQEAMSKIKARDEEMWNASKNVIKKMKLAFRRRGLQSDEVRKELDKCTLSSVICGDFNDVPNSYTYYTIRKERLDAFLEKDYGIGRTFMGLAPTLRIDYILPDRSFDVKQFSLADEGLSDHAMLVADIKIK